MLKFARRLKSTTLIKTDVPAAVTKVASKGTHFYEYTYSSIIYRAIILTSPYNRIQEYQHDELRKYF